MIKIHRIGIHTDEIHRFFGETYPTYVPFIPYYPVTATPRFSWNPSKKGYFTVFEIKFDLEGSRPRLRHLCASTHHPGSFEHIKFIPGSWPSCLDRQNHDFRGNYNKKGRGLLQTHFDPKFFRTFSRLIRLQEGLSIYLLWVEKSTGEVDHVFIPTTLGFQLNRGGGFWEILKKIVLEVPKFLCFDWVSISTSKIIIFSSFSFGIETHERSLHEKLIFSLITLIQEFVTTPGMDFDGSVP